MVIVKIVVIHGQHHKGSTWHITKLLLDRLSSTAEDIKEFYTNDIPHCTGCFTCIIKDEHLCPHRNIVGPIIEAIENADVILIESPTYCLSMSGQLKTFFDHMAYRWLIHRPHPSMKNKIAVAISTTAGAGASKVTKDIKRQMFWLCVGKTYRLDFRVLATNWDEVKPDLKEKINKSVTKTSKKIINSYNSVHPSILSKIMFQVMRSIQKNPWLDVDGEYWIKNNWV
ncbi:flavodoxin family protein [Clostridium celatum]|uniref:NADPH-dependent FMN reductase-like domain-containing protein n=1 Tax=Clostridium celatum DSM 1785 TaxID=545697 RepID=L1QA11_9CLOT|nr:NAD(P)H-dependent oxidoreductase [Clostridium celatum]EKY24452.1 hypothetical protein HMPREF0216_02675 [Clostridium celatum DSM 1785]MDU6295394.1 NAD(P)H-dependent oxidoreductase [Clostridium celatum]MDY3358849.1 NAD(P)H-dependent oxidoreductase [Clostridium celatum]